MHVLESVHVDPYIWNTGIIPTCKANPSKFVLNKNTGYDQIKIYTGGNDGLENTVSGPVALIVYKPA